MEQGYGPEYFIQKQIKKSRNIVILSTLLLFIIFSTSIVWTLFHYGKKESVILYSKIDTVENKVDSVYSKSVNTEISVNKIENQIDKIIETNNVIMSKLFTINNSVNKSNNYLDSLMTYSKN